MPSISNNEVPTSPAKQQKHTHAMVRTLIMVFGIALFVSLTGGGVFVYYKNKTGGGSVPPRTTENQVPVTKTGAPLPEQSAVTAPTETAPANDCDDILDRYEKIDAGANDERDVPQGPIGKVDTKHTSPEYAKLKDCWRGQKLGGSKPEINYGGMSEFIRPLKLGMTLQEALNAMPVGTSADVSAHPLHWLIDSCDPAHPDKDSNVRELCSYTRPMNGIYKLYGAKFPDNITLDLDREDADGKVLSWSLMTSLPVERYKTTDAVIRFERNEGGLAELGPPDLADESHAFWLFYGDAPANPLETVDLNVNRHGAAFVITLHVNDDEHEVSDERKATMKKIFAHAHS